MNQSFPLQELADLVRAELQGDPNLRVEGVASLANAGPSDISYCTGKEYARDLESTAAGAVVVDRDTSVREGLGALRVDQPGVAWTQILERFRPYERAFDSVSPQAFVSPDATIGENVGIGPGAYIGRGVTVGDGAEIYPGVTIGDRSSVGEGSRLYAGVHVYHECEIGRHVIIHAGVVIGGDGYGFVQEKQLNPLEPVRHRKVPQIGGVIIEDFVEIGANSTIDRGALEPTVIGRGTKIDNLVMVAHNCRVGAHSLLIAQSGLSGSVETGPYVTVAGQSGVAGHLRIGAKAVIGARTGIMNHVPDGEVYLGSPALPLSQARRAYAQIEHLPDFRRRLRAVEKKVDELGDDGAAERGTEEGGSADRG